MEFVPHGERPARAFPGRREGLRTPVGFELEDLSEGSLSTPLPISDSFEVRVSERIELPSGDVGDRIPTEDERLVPVPAVVRGGGEVRLAREALARWLLRFRLEPSPWPAPALRLRLRWSLGDRHESEAQTVTEGAPLTLRSFTRRAPPGPVRLAWSGASVVPGEATATLEVGRTAETEVVVRYDARGPTGADLVLDASALPADAPLPIALRWGGGDQGDAATEEPSPRVEQQGAASRRHALPAEWRTAAGVMILAGRWVSRPAPPPAWGDWRPTVERGGDVVVVADPTLDPALGSLRVRRSDGAPLLATYEDGSQRVEVEVGVGPGTVLRLLPPGDVTLEARLGAVPLAPATLHVRPGRVTTWEVRWRDR